MTVAIGSDANGSTWGQAQEVDINDTVQIDFAREWAGSYKTCEGGVPTGGCSMTGSLTGVNSTLDRWAQAIGGTAAHEAGHTYGLAHSDDDPPTDVSEPGPAPVPGEDSFTRHLMPAGRNLSGDDRAGYRRHISDRTFGLLATNVGLSVQTMHNWDLVNPNAQEARSPTIDFLSTQPSMNLAWFWSGSISPCTSPVVTGPLGTSVFQGVTYNRFRVTWSAPNAAWAGGSPGALPGGASFHIGATFTGVDFNQPDPILIQNITLFDSSSRPLTLHPRLPMYDAGTLDSADGTFTLSFLAQPGATPLVMHDAAIYQLPRVASIDSMNGKGAPYTFDKTPIRPWSGGVCKATPKRKGNVVARCAVASIEDKPHVTLVHRLGEKGVYDCSRGVPYVNPPNAQDSPGTPDYEGPVCAGATRDPFLSTTIYAIATFVDPNAQYYDPRKKAYVVGPLESKVYYQFAGVRDTNKLREAAGAVAQGPLQQKSTDVCGNVGDPRCSPFMK